MAVPNIQTKEFTLFKRPIPKWPDWLDWGVNPTCDLILNLKTNIEGSDGIYIGECIENGQQIVVNGRGALNSEDKLILGYTEMGAWAIDSPQCVVFKKKDLFLVHRLER